MIWIKIRTQDGKNIRISIPITLYVLLELLDCMLNFMTFVCLFVPKMHRSGSRSSVYGVKELIRMLMVLINSIHEDGPYDLVDVAAGQTQVAIQIR